MNNNEVISSLSVAWITDRLPTREDAIEGYVWFWSEIDNKPSIRLYTMIRKGNPWMPFIVPDPYVKPKRWSVDWNEYCNCYVITDGEQRIQLHFNQCKDAAQRICDIYNEVMP